jgi:hypothetical protein
MHRFVVVFLFAGSLAACGEDKDYGDPLTNPSAPALASASVTNAVALQTDTSNESALNALNGLSGNFNSITGIKYQERQQQAPGPQRPPLSVDDACVVQTDSSITWTDCLYAENTVNGSVTRSGSTVDVDVHFHYQDTTDNRTQDVDAGGSIDITPTSLTGTLSFDLHIDSDGFSTSGDFDGYYDVVMADNCAVDGQAEIRGHASAAGVSQTIWVLAEFGPTCGDVVVR